ncbi:TPA: DNA-binding protein, partial [Proteus mirabilis]|nr:DNA-binding protein [Proteus mirabilis]HEK3104403.1 DNA-binding protein [Proteus mirabilis]
RKVAYADIVAYKNELEQKRLDALAELSQLDQEMDMGY